MSNARGTERRRASEKIRVTPRAKGVIAHKAMEAGCAMSELVEQTFEGTAPRARGGIRRLPVDTKTYLRATEEAEKRGCSVEALLADLLPTQRHAISPCRYCGKTVRNPTDKHRWHKLDCALYADKGFKVRAK